MNWLARFEIDAEPAFREGLVDSYAWHQKVWECFPGQPDKRRHFLSRVEMLEGAFRLWILAAERPERPAWCPAEAFDMK